MDTVRLASVVLALSLLAIPAPTTAQPAHRLGDAAFGLELTGLDWQRASSDAVPRHRGRPGFLDAALGLDGDTRLAVAIAQRIPWQALGTSTDPGFDDATLERFVFDSAEAVASQPGVELVASGLVGRDRADGLRIGHLEVLRLDSGLRDELALALPTPEGPIRQLTLSIPTDEGLVQVFVYMPADAELVRDRVIAALEQGGVDARPRARPQAPQKPQRDLTTLFLGLGAAALLLLVGVRIYLVLRRRRLRDEAQDPLGRGTTAPQGLTPDGSTPRAAWEDADGADEDGR